MKWHLSILVLLSLFSSFCFAKAFMKAHVKLSPAGSFIAETSDVKGTVQGKGNAFQGQDIRINLKNLKTGIELRDEHTQKHLETDKKGFEEAILLKAVGKDGKGKAKIRFHGKTGTVAGTYKILEGGKFILATFPMKLAEYGITGIRYMGVGVKDEVNIEVQVPAVSIP